MRKCFRNIFFVFWLSSLLGCKTQTNVSALFRQGPYYAILPDNFVNKIEFRNDSIVAILLNPMSDFQPQDTTVQIINNYTFKGGIYTLAIQHINKSKPLDTAFNIVYATYNSEGNMLISAYGVKNVSNNLKSAENHTNYKFYEHFYFTIFSETNFNALRKLKRLSTVNQEQGQQITEYLKNQFLNNQSKIAEISKYDMYLSGSSKELTTRTFIHFKINPIDYTDDEAREIFMHTLK